ncbi:hypothetical protein CR513_59715, partial [Mucuna pruriens]
MVRARVSHSRQMHDLRSAITGAWQKMCVRGGFDRICQNHIFLRFGIEAEEEFCSLPLFRSQVNRLND